MEYGSNVRKVEKAMKDALKNDRARIQVGRISGFGLMEMSRQRLRTGVLEATTRSCPHCDGSGLVRTASSAGLSALRLIEDEAAKGKGTIITLCASQEAAIYVLNAKRADLAEIEKLYGVQVEVVPEGENEGAKMRVVSSGPRPEFLPTFEPIVDDEDVTLDAEFEDEDEEEEEETRNEGEADSDSGRKRRKRRRGGRSRERRDNGDAEAESAGTTVADDGDDDTGEAAAFEEGAGSDESDAPRKRRRRGGRRRRPDRNRADEGDLVAGSVGEGAGHGAEDQADEPQAASGEDAGSEPVAAEPAADEAPAKPRRTRRKKGDAAPVAETEGNGVAELAVVEPAAEEPAAEAPAKPVRARRKKADAEAPVTPAAEADEAPAAAEPAVDAPAKPKRARRKKADAETATVTEDVPVDASPPAAVATASAQQDTGEADDGTPRQGWWQRTFGN